MAAQKKKGKPGCRLAKLLPNGGANTFPTWEMVSVIPKAVPKSLGPTPSVSMIIVQAIAINPSINMPDNIIKTQIKTPSTTGKRKKQIRVTNRAAYKIDFLEPVLSDNEDKGTTHRVLNPKKIARVPSALAGLQPCSRR